ncbi:MAG TPA: 6-phosphogluconolactonase [Chthoniobacterales bacterium]|jgi:6-phosphogluconolactonase
MSRQIVRTKNFANDAASFILEKGGAAILERGEFRVALSGGETPRPVYSELARSSIPWNKTILTFGDERCVPPEDKQSNFRMVSETLLKPAGVPESSVLRMRGEIEPSIAALEYQKRLDALATDRGEKIYQHDLILLGLGDDGHTASLFPGTAALSEMVQRVVANYAAKLQSWRLTFTFPLIFAGRAVCFLIGANKDPKLIERIFAGDESLPAARVDKNAREVTWIIAESP